MGVADVPFPFPYAQLLTYVLVIYSCFMPIYITAFTKSYWAQAILTFLLFQGIWGVNEVAKELENPFGPDTNDISLPDFHARFIDVLEEIHVGHEAIETGERNQRELEEIRKSTVFTATSSGALQGQ